MPLPLIPPPASDIYAKFLPRELQAWLDINPISKLTRTTAYITLPTFSQSVNWLGYSDIVAAFNYEGPNNFSLNEIVTQIPVNPNYLLAISWRDGNGHIYRYALWANVGEVFNFPVNLYTGQMIAKNFRFEIWSTANSGSEIVQATPITIYTGVLGKQDYRWGSDFVLVNADAISTVFGISEVNQPLLPVTAPSVGTFFNWFRADTGVSGINWIPKQGIGYVTTNVNTGGGDIGTNTDSSIGNNLYVNTLLNSLSGATNGNDPTDIWIMLKIFGDGQLVTIMNGASVISELTVASGVLSQDSNVLNPNAPLVFGHWYVIEWFYTGVNNGVTVWDITDLFNIDPITYVGLSNARTGGNTFVLSNNLTGNVDITDILIYDGTANNESISGPNLAYFQNRYNQLFTLPFVFPMGSYSQPNTPSTIPLYKNQLNISQGNVITASSGGGVLGQG